MPAVNRSIRELFSSGEAHGPASRPSPVLTDLQLGITLHQQGDLDGAEALYRKSLLAAPHQADPLHLLGVISLQRGEPGNALAFFKRALALRPDVVEFHLSLGSAHRALHDLPQAALAFEQALRLDSRQRRAWLELAEVMTAMGQAPLAVQCYEQALKLDPSDTVARVNLAALLRQQGDSKLAADLLAELAHRPHAPPLVKYNLANALSDLGQFDQARAMYIAALSTHPHPARVLYNLMQIMRVRSEDRSQLHRWAADVKERTESAEDLCYYHFALGKAHDDLGDYESAWKHYVIANALAGYDFDIEAHRQWVSQTMAVFDAAFFDQRPVWGSRSATPVFIVGMPRSGTSLVEQILASHPLVHAAGERLEWGRIVEEWTSQQGQQPGDPLAALKLTESGARALADRYVAQLSPPEAAACFTDKMPTNFLLLGWIAACFPKARVIHCRRDPRDTCLSCYFQHFTHGLPFAYSLVHLVDYYREYARLMHHWNRTLPLPIHEVDYDSLVRSPRSTIQEIIRFCGLPWDDACLESHTSERSVSTASVWQVRQPIYSRSSGRWRNYSRFAQPLLDAFGDRSLAAGEAE